MTNIIEVNGLSKYYENKAAINNILFKVKEGEILGLLGPNGAGKTTLISILIGLTKPSSGRASIFNLDIIKDSRLIRQKIGLVPQEIVNHGFFNVEQVLKFHSGYYGINKNEEQIEYLLDKLALRDQRKKLVSQLSGGMRRRLLIAKALVHSPPLLLLDEPTAGVDVELRNHLWKFVRELNAGGTTVLLTTHYLKEAEELCDRIAVLNHGNLISLDKTQNMITRLTQREVRISLTSPEPWAEKPADITIENSRIKITLPRSVSIGELLTRIKIPLTKLADISISEGGLEDAFVALIKKSENSDNKN